MTSSTIGAHRCASGVCGECRACHTRRNWRAGCFAAIGSKRGDRWTPEEEGELRAMAGRFTAAEIAHRLGCRTSAAVHVRAHALGVYIQTEDWTQHRICQLFGAWEGTAARAWFASGLIVGYRLPPGAGCRQGEWRVREADLEAFILDCPWAYDATRMVPQTHRLAQLARRVQRRDPWVGIDEVRAYVGGSRGAMVRWCHNGVIPFKRRHVSGKRGGRSGHIVVRAADLPAARETILQRQREARAFIQANLLDTMRQRRAATRRAA